MIVPTTINSNSMDFGIVHRVAVSFYIMNSTGSFLLKSVLG